MTCHLKLIFFNPWNDLIGADPKNLIFNRKQNQKKEIISASQDRLCWEIIETFPGRNAYLFIHLALFFAEYLFVLFNWKNLAIGKHCVGWWRGKSNNSLFSESYACLVFYSHWLLSWPSYFCRPDLSVRSDGTIPQDPFPPSMTSILTGRVGSLPTRSRRLGLINRLIMRFGGTARVPSGLPMLVGLKSLPET